MASRRSGPSGLAAALGQIGGRGTVGTRYHYSSGRAGASAGRGLPGLPSTWRPSVPSRIPSGSRTAPSPPLPTCSESRKAHRCGGIELEYPRHSGSVFWAGNPFAHHPDTGRLRRGLQTGPTPSSPRDVFETATTKYADILLPPRIRWKRRHYRGSAAARGS